MKHLIFIIYALLGSVNIAKAQVVISTSDLIGTKWQTAKQYDDQSKVYYEYTKEAMIRHKSNGGISTYPCYLSNTIPTKFDNDKVGVITKGCHIIEYNTKLDVLYCYSIKSFNKTDRTMVLENEDGSTTTYIMIPSNKPRNQSANEPVLDPSIW